MQKVKTRIKMINPLSHKDLNFDQIVYFTSINDSLFCVTKARVFSMNKYDVTLYSSRSSTYIVPYNNIYFNIDDAISNCKQSIENVDIIKKSDNESEFKLQG